MTDERDPLDAAATGADSDELAEIADQRSRRPLIERDVDPDAERAADPTAHGHELPDRLDAPLETPVDDLLDQVIAEELDDDRDA